MATAQETNTLAAISSRARFPQAADLSPSEARFILDIGFSDEDQTVLRDLLMKNREGTISADEKELLGNLLSISYFFDILRSKARLSLKQSDQSGPRRD